MHGAPALNEKMSFEIIPSGMTEQGEQHHSRQNSLIGAAQSVFSHGYMAHRACRPSTKLGAIKNNRQQIKGAVKPPVIHMYVSVSTTLKQRDGVGDGPSIRLAMSSRKSEVLICARSGRIINSHHLFHAVTILAGPAYAGSECSLRSKSSRLWGEAGRSRLPRWARINIPGPRPHLHIQRLISTDWGWNGSNFSSSGFLNEVHLFF